VGSQKVLFPKNSKFVLPNFISTFLPTFHFFHFHNFCLTKKFTTFFTFFHNFLLTIILFIPSTFFHFFPEHFFHKNFNKNPPPPKENCPQNIPIPQNMPPKKKQSHEKNSPPKCPSHPNKNCAPKYFVPRN
jgi:hypothetical protein